MKSVADINNEDAVSPVIGIMLMIVVTVIIAAVVTMFATGVVSTAEKAPNVVLDVNFESAHLDVKSGYTYPVMELRYVSGDIPLDTSKMTIASKWTDTDGYLYSWVYDGTQTTESGQSPLVYPRAVYLWNGKDVHFGVYEMKPGDSMITPSIYEQSEISTNPYWMVIFGGEGNTNALDVGTEVLITITYDDFVIFNKEVTIK